jgi:hypothetical protein
MMWHTPGLLGNGNAASLWGNATSGSARQAPASLPPELFTFQQRRVDYGHTTMAFMHQQITGTDLVRELELSANGEPRPA